MQKLKREAWKEQGWERGPAIPGGNQGHTFLARRNTDPPESFGYVLKALKRQGEIDRRAMFCAEIRAMGVLDHPGIIGVAGTNAESFRDSVELFVVTPRVEGRDLEDLVRADTLETDNAARLTISVLEILDHCHKRGVIHRDIKPCHVILRNNSLDAPVLIDFGLAYHRDTQPSDAATEPGHGKGNRFLIGPEHLTHDPNVCRNPVTDICQCLGLLFFIITKNYPGALRDEHNRKPHERVSLESLRPGIPQWKRDSLLQIFDIGFEWEPWHRWQSIDSLTTRLRDLLGNQVQSDISFRLELSQIMRLARTQSDTSRFKTACQMAEGLIEVLHSVVNVLKSETEEYLLIECGQSSQLGTTLAKPWIAFRHKLDQTKSKAVSFAVELVNNRRIDVSLAPYTGRLAIFPNDQPIGLTSFELGFPEYRDSVRPLLMSYLARCVSEVLGIDTDSGITHKKADTTGC